MKKSTVFTKLLFHYGKKSILGKMKIVIGTESFSPNVSGVAIFAERLAEFLARNNVSTYIFAPSPNAKTFWEKKHKNLEILRLASISNPFRRTNRLSLLPKKRIFVEIERLKPDLIHIQDPGAISTGLVAKARLDKIPVIATNHFSLEFILSYVKSLKFAHPLFSYFLKRYFANFYNRCSLITTPSQTAADLIKNWGFRTPLKVLSNGIDLERFHPADSKSETRRKFNLPDKPIILYSGRVDKDKSVDVLVRAMAVVLKKIPAHLFFVGSGERIEEIKNLVRELGLESNVTFQGWINYKSADFPLIYQTADLFASASTIETQSIVMLEALASGLPIVASAAGSFPEFVKDGENGFLFPVGDENKMAQRVIEVLEDKKLRAVLCRGSRFKAEEHESNRCLERFLFTYKEIIKNYRGESNDKNLNL